MQGVLNVRAALALATVMAASPAAAQAPGMFAGEDDYYFGWWPSCPVELTDRRIREAVADQGFGHIFLNARHDQRVQVRATQGQWVYLLQVDTCTGDIMYGQRLRPS